MTEVRAQLLAKGGIIQWTDTPKERMAMVKGEEQEEPREELAREVAEKKALEVTESTCFGKKIEQSVS